MLEITNLGASYGEHTVLQGVNIHAKAGEIVCVLGINGCGKTTLLRCIADLIPCTGNVALHGKALHGQSRRAIAQQVALLSQINVGMFSYTVKQMVAMGRYARQKAGFFQVQNQQDEAFVQACMQQTKIDDLQDRQLYELSGGQLQRVYLACVFAQDPQLILLDEPTNHLDFPFQLELTSLLKRWVAQENRCVVAVLHDLNLAFHFADRIVLLKEGKVVADCPTDAFPMECIDEVYQIDVRGYMKSSLSQWTKENTNG